MRVCVSVCVCYMCSRVFLKAICSATKFCSLTPNAYTSKVKLSSSSGCFPRQRYYLPQTRFACARIFPKISFGSSTSLNWPFTSSDAMRGVGQLLRPTSMKARYFCTYLVVSRKIRLLLVPRVMLRGPAPFFAAVPCNVSKVFKVTERPPTMHLFLL